MGGKFIGIEEAVVIGVGAAMVMLGVATHAGDLSVFLWIEFAVVISIQSRKAGLNTLDKNDEPGLLPGQLGGELFGIEKAIVVEVAFLKVLFSVVARLHVERQELLERKFSCPVKVDDCHGSLNDWHGVVLLTEDGEGRQDGKEQKKWEGFHALTNLAGLRIRLPAGKLPCNTKVIPGILEASIRSDRSFPDVQ